MIAPDPPPTTALRTVLAAIRHDFAQGKYHPRERLVEADLMKRYSATRSAIREALLQLDSEGLVERRPNRGAQVAAMSPEEALEIAEVRLGLEVICAGYAAQRGLPDEKLALLELAHTMETTATLGRTLEYLELNAQFHAQIYTMARHATARTILERFDSRPIDRFVPTPFLAPPPEHSLKEHVQLATEIIAGNATAARATMERHLRPNIDKLAELGRPYESDDQH